jgi:hypothetical protein
MAASAMPYGKQQFFDAAGVSLALGSVAFFIPGTTTPKDTWQDSGQTTLNTNPVALDASGSAIVYVSGAYRQIVKDLLGNTIWDQVITAPSYALNADLQTGLSAISENVFTVPTLSPGHALFDVTVPTDPTGGAGDGYVDNVASVQNRSISTGGIFGNAAYRYLDRAGTERAAAGYSRNAAIQPNGYDADVFFIEIGNAFTTDASTTDFEVVTTLMGGGPEAPGSAVHQPLLSYNHANARWDFHTHKLPGSVNSNVDFNIGYPNVSQYQLTIGGTQTGFRFREYIQPNLFAITTNNGGMAAGGIVRDAAGASSWAQFMGNSTAYNEWSINYSAVGSATYTKYFEIDAAGHVIIPQGLGNYASDSAAATGGVPVNGLYRNGSAVQVRVS